MGLSNIEHDTQESDDTSNSHGTPSPLLPSEVWCLFRVQGSPLVNLTPCKTSNKATSVEEEYFWKLDTKEEREDSEEDFYSTVEDTDIMEDGLSSADGSICSYRSTGLYRLLHILRYILKAYILDNF